MDVVVTVPQTFGLDTWINEGDPAGSRWSGQEWHFYLGGPRPTISVHERVYVVYAGALRGYAPLVRVEQDGQQFALVRHGNAIACTIPTYIRGFRGWRYRWWEREEETDFSDWKNPDAVSVSPIHPICAAGFTAQFAWKQPVGEHHLIARSAQLNTYDFLFLGIGKEINYSLRSMHWRWIALHGTQLFSLPSDFAMFRDQFHSHTLPGEVARSGPETTPRTRLLFESLTEAMYSAKRWSHANSHPFSQAGKHNNAIGQPKSVAVHPEGLL